MDPTLFSELIFGIKAHMAFFRPEIVLVLAILTVILFDLIALREDSWLLGYWALVFVFLATGFLVRFYDTGGAREVLFGMVAVDSFSSFFRLLFLVGTIPIIGLTMLSENLRGRRMGEFYAILLSSVLGAMLLASANDLLMVYLGIELVSIPSFILVIYDKTERDSSEAGLKYILYGAVSSGSMIYGASLIYGLTGTTQLDDLARLVATVESPYVVLVASFLLLIGFAYKLAMFPLHFWAPDTYQGAPTVVTAFLAVISKAAGFAVFMRFLWAYAGNDGTFATVDWTTIVAFLAALTMTYGNLGALFQDDVKRLLAYSSIAHVGYALVGVAAFGGTEVWGMGTVAFYLVAYLFMNLGAFAVVVLVENQTGSVDISAFRGLAKRAPLLGVAMSVFLFSLIGLPPTAGFVGKFQVFLAGIDQGLLWLVIVGAINTAVSVYYYARIFRTMCLEDLPEGPRREAGVSWNVPRAGKALVLVLLLMVLYLGTLFSTVQDWTQSIRIRQEAGYGTGGPVAEAPRTPGHDG